MGFLRDRGGGRRLARRHRGRWPNPPACACCAIPAIAARATRCGTACWRPGASGRCSPMPIFRRPSKSWKAVERGGAQRRAGGHRLARAGPHAGRRAPAALPRNHGAVVQPGDAAGHGAAVPRHAVRLQAVRDRGRRARFSGGSGWTGSASTWKCCSSPSGWGYRTLEVPVRWNDVAGTKVSLMRGVAAFLDPLKVRWNGIDGEVPVERGLGVGVGDGD